MGDSLNNHVENSTLLPLSWVLNKRYNRIILTAYDANRRGEQGGFVAETWILEDAFNKPK